MTVIKRVIFDDEDELMTMHARPNRIIVRKDFKDGNSYTLQYTRIRIKTDGNHRITRQWHVSIYVGDNKSADMYRKGWLPHRITGNGSIKCLLSIARQLDWFVKRMRWNEELIVTWADEQRGRVYSRLLRNTAFVADGDAIIARNPYYWSWDEEQGAEQ